MLLITNKQDGFTTGVEFRNGYFFYAGKIFNKSQKSKYMINRRYGI